MKRILVVIIGWCFIAGRFVECGEYDGESYSFYKFKGPVSGKVEKVYVADGHNGQKLDFRAKPDYSYSYGVKDPSTGNRQEHQEMRDGDVVHGQYTVLQSDGIVRVVKYTADPQNGFQATVEYH